MRRSLSLCLALVACSGTPGTPDGSAGGVDAARDTGSAADVASPDTGLPRVDTGVGPTDAGGSATDAGNPIHAGRVITVSGRQVLVDGVPIELHGVCWSPVQRGHHLPADFVGAAPMDVPLMQGLGLNAIRTYDAILDPGVLDRFAAAGIWVIMTVYAWGGDPESAATDRVAAVMDHPAILMWLVGNEWNYNGLYTGVPHDEAQARLERIATAIHALDPSRPVGTVHGELPSAATIAAMPHIQVWGLNVYRGIGFGDLFTRWTALHGAPMFVSEYGSDAWDARGSGMENDAAQAEATTALTNEILAHASARDPDAAALGGTIFEWSDEWWKDGAGTDDTHDTGGVAPGGGPYPDQTFNEEWWGIVDVDRHPRAAAEALRAIYGH